MGDLFEFDSLPPLYAVMGNPIGHSKSPRIHELFAKACNVRIDYRAIQVDPGGFKQAVRSFQGAGGQGLNVTVPFKFEASALADRRSPRVELAKSANTLKMESDGIFADNTDGVGLVNDLQRNLGCSIAGRRVLLVGAGGAASGVVGPLLEQQPVSLIIANRSIDRAVALATRFAAFGPVRGRGFDALDDDGFDIIVNATSASLGGDIPALSPGVLSGAVLVYDMMYAPTATPFLQWASQHRAERVADGLGMLVEQAAVSFQIWHGVHPATVDVIATLRADLSAG
ncbi:MAG: shikimate dehydrogenase [Gammaproteobacteria bacterium]|nr:shikimate dehydrogenase [Gammaproteobacteria bacterium]MDH3465829.1 shikimate dehydrogenase [Gammaproteobacteria bacterium]